MELCERFCYYGMVAILPTYLTGFFGFKQATAVMIMSALSFSSYIFAFVGATVSDSYLGRYGTILSFSCCYAVGVGLLASSALEVISGQIPRNPWAVFVGLALIAFGTGGIKPCVSSFGGDQIEKADNRARFFAYFYLMVNVGSFVSMFLVPLIKSKSCFGQKECYVGALGLPAALMVVALLIFGFGKRLYKPSPPPNRIMQSFFGAIGRAISNKVRLIVGRVPYDRPEHWLYYASDKYSAPLIHDCVAMLRVLVTFLPLCLYWGLYSQMSNRWVFQATLMTGKLGSWNIQPEQMGMANCVLVLVFVPLFDGLLYPLLGKISGRKLTHYGKIIISLVLGVLSFVVAAALQRIIDGRGTFVADPLNAENLKCVAGCVHMAWQIPQYIILTASEVFLCTSNLALAYAMAPKELKSLCSAMSMVTNAAGSLLVILMAKIDPVAWFTKSHGAFWNFIMWAALCVLGITWFLATTWNMVFPEDKDHEEPEKLEEVKVVEMDEAPAGSTSELIQKKAQDL